MYVITGAGGRTGRAAALRLLSGGHRVRVVGRSATRLADLAERGAEVREADPADAAALTTAFAGADSVYAVLQPNYLPGHPAFAAFQDQLTAALADAVAASGVRRVVGLSSWGAQHATGTGPVKGLHRFENRLSAVPGVEAVWLRAGYFMENLLGYVESVRDHGRVSAPFRPDVPIPFICTGDVGAAVADALTGPWQGIRELHGERDLTMAEVMDVIAGAVDQPGLEYDQVSIAEFRDGLLRDGVAENVAEMMAEVGEAMNTGHLCTIQPRSAETTTPTSIETFIRDEFLPLYRTP
ncbi:NAD(P)H-binding protein [Amycolatopsis jejuensis]|uniref:NmrA family NAD(P)-binding protein n=1 Tax=Amycolatopsis jejuensis TaxID=330084 RepID=UPI0005264B5C|nr:NAD(P)H-binding protein [Amycolatopsis jejuensis]